MSLKTIADVIRDQFEVPEGYDELYVRSIEPGRANQFGFEWPRTPGATVTANLADIGTNNQTGCPSGEGDGFCLATTHSVMASGIFKARTLLVVAVREEDIVGSELDDQKIRVRHAMVVACVNGSKLVRRFGAGMDLTGDNLAGADLAGADLAGADLTWATLYGAHLAGANLIGARLTGANLTGANLTGARLPGANLVGANLSGADLTGANLTGADLFGAILAGARLTGADLFGADLTNADLTNADLTGANIEDAIR